MFKQRWFVPFLIVVGVLAVASMACGALTDLLPGGGDQPDEAEEAPIEEADEEPTAIPPTATPAPTSTPAPVGLTASNSDQLEHAAYIPVSENHLLNSVVFDPRGGYDAFTFGFETYVDKWDVLSGDHIREMRGHTAFGWSMAWSPDGALLASAGQDFKVRIWDTETGQELNAIPINSYGYRMTWSPDSQYLAVVGDFISRVEIFDVSSGTIVAEPKSGGFTLFGIDWSDDGSLLAVSDLGGNIAIYDVNSNFDLVTTLQSDGNGWDVAFSPDAALLVGCNVGGAVEFWDTSNWTLITSDEAYPSQCSDATFTHNGEVVITVGDDAMILWDAQTAEVMRSYPLDRFGWYVDVSADDMIVAVASDDGLLQLFEMP